MGMAMPTVLLLKVKMVMPMLSSGGARLTAQKKGHRPYGGLYRSDLHSDCPERFRIKRVYASKVVKLTV